MDICIVTNDSLLARFLILELAEAGFSAEQSDAPKGDSRLNIYDLDSFQGETAGEAVGFSYDDSNASRAECFLPRPINAAKLIKTVSEKLSSPHKKFESEVLTLTKATRKVKTSLGEVRLSEKELALLLKLFDVPVLKREDASSLFGDRESNVVDVYMHYLRKKLKAVCPYDAIKSNRGEGYSLIFPLNIV